MGWSDDIYSRRTSHDGSPRALLSAEPQTPEKASRTSTQPSSSPLSSAKALRGSVAEVQPLTPSPGGSKPPLPNGTRRSTSLDRRSSSFDRGSPEKGGDNMGSLLLVGAAVATGALQKAGLIPASPRRSSRESPRPGSAPTRRTSRERPPPPQPILATTPRGYHDAKVKTPRGNGVTPRTPRSVRFSDEPQEEGTPPPRTPRNHPPPSPPSASPRRSPRAGGGVDVGKALQVVARPVGQATFTVAKAPLQLAAALLDAIQGATTSVVTGAAGVVSSPFRARNTARRHRAPKSPRTSNLRIQTPTPVSPAGSAGSGSGGGNSGGGSSGRHGSVDIPRLSLADKGVGGGTGGKQASPTQSPLNSGRSTPGSRGSGSGGESGGKRRKKDRAPVRGGPFGFLGGNKLAARCEAAEAAADAQEAAAAKLRVALAQSEARLQAALAVGRDTQEAAALETARRATALSEANKQLEKLELKLKSRQATVDNLVLQTPRGGSHMPASPSGITAASPRLTPLALPSPRVSLSGAGAAAAAPSPRGLQANSWASSPRASDSGRGEAGGGGAIAERRIAELRAKLTMQTSRTEEALAKVEDLQQLLVERELEVADYEAKLRTGLSEAQAATADELRAQLATERQRNSDQAQVMKHLQESLGADAEQITDLKQQLEESQAIIDSFDEQAQSQVAYVADLQDMCEELQAMQSTMTEQNSASSHQATTLQEQLNVSLGVIEQLEKAAEEQKRETAEARKALEAQLEEAQTTAEETKRRVQELEMLLKVAETDRDAAASALASHGGGTGGSSEDKGGAAASDSQWDGRMLPSVKRLSTREEELYKHQLAELQAEVTALRKVSRAARGAEADSSVGMHQLEARLAVAAIEHKQDVRRMTETIEGLEDQLRVLRRQALLRDPAARSRSGVTESEEASALEHAGSPGDDAALRQGSRGLSSEGSTGTTPPQPGPVANRLLVLTKRLEDVMGVSLQRTNSSHQRMSLEANRASLDRGRPSFDRGAGRPSLDRPLPRASSDLGSRPPPRPGSRQSMDVGGGPGGIGFPRMSADLGARRPPRGSTDRRSMERPPFMGAAPHRTPVPVAEAGSRGSGEPPSPTAGAPTASGLLASGFGGITSQFPLGGRSSTDRSSSAPPPRSSGALSAPSAASSVPSQLSISSSSSAGGGGGGGGASAAVGPATPVQSAHVEQPIGRQSPPISSAFATPEVQQHPAAAMVPGNIFNFETASSRLDPTLEEPGSARSGNSNPNSARGGSPAGGSSPKRI